MVPFAEPQRPAGDGIKPRIAVGTEGHSEVAVGRDGNVERRIGAYALVVNGKNRFGNGKVLLPPHPEGHGSGHVILQVGQIRFSDMLSWRT